MTHITDYLERNARMFPDKTAIIDGGSTISWGQLNEAADTVARNIVARLAHHQTQQVIGVLLPNGISFVKIYLVILKACHIAMQIDPSYKKLEIKAITQQIDHALFVAADGAEGALNYRQLLNPTDSDMKPLKLAADQQIASLIFTSGTTGRPKAATASHANHIWNIRVCSEVWDWTSNDNLLISLPLSHWYGLVMGLSGAIYHGGTLYLHEHFNPQQTLEDLASGQISLFTHIAPVYNKLLEVKGDYDLSGVRLCISGGAPLPPKVSDEFYARFGIRIIECYGSSETGRIAANHVDNPRNGSPGPPLRGVKVKISPAGEVLVKTPGLFPGYYHNAPATKAKLTADGWWRTGDLGELKDGRLILKGRTQEKIRRFGYTISPRDIEWAMHHNPKIRDIHVLGLQQENADNDLLAYFLAGEITEQEVIAYCKQNLLFAWRPDKIFIMDHLPRTANGKLKIVAMKEMLNAQTKI